MKTPLAVLAAIAVVAGGMFALPMLSAGEAQAQQQKWVQHGGKAGPRAGQQQRAVRGGRNASARRNANRGGRNAAVRNANRGGARNAAVRGGRNTRVVHARYRGGYYGGRYRGRYYGGRRWYGGGWYGGRWWGPGYYDNGWGAFGVGAAVGLTTGAIVGAAVSDGPVYVEPGDTYYTGPGGRVMSRNDGVVVSDVPGAGGYAPFSPGWVDYCSSKYRSFNPQTGMYLGYDGYRHYCQ